MPKKTSYDNWGGSGDRRDIIESNYSNLFDGDQEKSAVSVGRGSSRQLDIKFKLNGYISEARFHGHKWMSVNKKEVFLNEKRLNISYSSKTIKFDEVLRVSYGDTLKIRIQHQYMTPGGGTASASFNELEFKIYAYPLKTLISSGEKYVEYEDHWTAVTKPLLSQDAFDEHGMEDLGVFNREVQSVIKSPFYMTHKEDLGNGKVFSRKIDLTKYFDVRGVDIEN